MDEGRPLEWNDTISRDDSFTQIEPGDYDFTIDHYERGRSQGSDKIPSSNMAIVYFNIHAEGSPQIRENFILHTKLEWKISQLFSCNLMLIRNRTHYRTYGQAVKIVINENQYT